MTERAPLAPWELDQLARYNSEAWRGLMHKPEWVCRMAALQKRFDENGFIQHDK